MCGEICFVCFGRTIEILMLFYRLLFMGCQFNSLGVYISFLSNILLLSNVSSCMLPTGTFHADLMRSINIPLVFPGAEIYLFIYVSLCPQLGSARLTLFSQSANLWRQSPKLGQASSLTPTKTHTTVYVQYQVSQS